MSADDADLDELIHRADLDGLVRMIDDRCATRDWAGLLRVRDRARHAVDTGRQLWPAATLAEYRLALLAPPDSSAAVLDESDGLSGRFTIGPLTEVAAQHHTWADLAPVLDRGPRAAFVAHERVLRGEVIADADRPAGGARPPARAPAVGAGVRARGVHRRRRGVPDARPARRTGPRSTPDGAERLDDDVDLAVRQLVEPWLASSNGHLEVACVEGDVAAAIGALGVRHARAGRARPGDRAGLVRVGRRERRRPRSPARRRLGPLRRLVVARRRSAT